MSTANNLKCILTIEDDRHFFEKDLKSNFPKFSWKIALTAKAALRILKDNQIQENGEFASKIDLILLDLKLDETSHRLEGMELLPKLRKLYPIIPVIILTRERRPRIVIQALNIGAFSFLGKNDFDPLHWTQTIKNAIEQKVERERRLKGDAKIHPFIGEHFRVKKIKEQLQKAGNDAHCSSILLTGETGVGKEIAARYLYRHSLRKHKPFESVSLTAISTDITTLKSELFGHVKGAFTGATHDKEGLFKQADGGVLFLDELGDAPLEIQAALLRFLQDKKIRPFGSTEEIQLDVQIVAATNKDLKKALKDGAFRSDFYARLEECPIPILPLRERKEDIFLIANHYLQSRFGKGYTVDTVMDSSVRNRLLTYHWPRNVRQLITYLKRMIREKTEVLLKKGAVIDVTFLPFEIFEKEEQVPRSLQENLKLDIVKIELTYIEKSLMNSGKNKGKAATLLGLYPSNMKGKIDKYREQFPEIFERFPCICECYKIW